MTKSVLNKGIKFGAIKAELERLGVTEITVNGETFSTVEFLQNEVDLQEKRKSTSKKKDNSVFEERIAEILEENGTMTATEIFKADVETLGSIQKVTACLKAMPNVVRNVDGKKVTFSLS